MRLDILSGLIWVQTVCKVNQQMTLVGKELTHFFDVAENLLIIVLHNGCHYRICTLEFFLMYSK